MVYVRKNHGYFCACKKVKEKGRWKEKYLKCFPTEEELAKYLETWKPLPDKKYKTVIIDPPWEIEKIKRDVRPNQKKMDYPTMNLFEIKNFGFTELFNEKGCHVYLWTTQKHLRDAFYLFDAWGVNYQCLLTWIKNVGFTPFSWMYSTEFVLFGRVGNQDVLKKGLRTDFEGKVREHSRKPYEFYERVREASPDPRINVFGREKIEGFDVYGNETNKFDGY